VADVIEPEIPTERIGLVVFTLMSPRGEKHTTAQLAMLVGIEHAGVWRMLDKLSRVVPICRDTDGWFIPVRESS
jgi:hypothetical protein